MEMKEKIANAISPPETPIILWYKIHKKKLELVDIRKELEGESI